MPFRQSLLKLTLAITLLAGNVCYGQQSTADSLKKILGFTNDTNRVSMLLKLCEAYMRFSPRKAIDPANEARILSIQLSNDTLEAKSLWVLGRANYTAGSFGEAIVDLKQAENLFEQVSMPGFAASVMLNMADCYRDKGNYNEALDQSLKAYKAFERVGDKKGMSGALIVSGNVYRGMKNYNKAINDYEKALSLSHETGDVKNEASCLNNLSNVYSDKGDNEKAVSYLEKAKTLYENAGDKFNLAKVLNNTGAVYFEIGKYDEATELFLQSLDIRKEIGDKRGMASSLGNLGMVSLAQQKPDKAIDYLNRALDLAKKTGAVELQMEILKYLSDSYNMLGDNAKSLDFYKSYSSLKDSVFNNNLSESIAEMQARYDVEKAESETRAQEKEKKLITFSAVGGGILLFIIIIIIWNRAMARKKTNIRLNQQKIEIEQKNAELHSANKVIELKNKDITDSIVYARRIQEAILPEVEFQSTFGEKGFVLYRPKDIVSGDFYFYRLVSINGKKRAIIAAVDCTGHGVPGAFMSIVTNDMIVSVIDGNEAASPAELLDGLNRAMSDKMRHTIDDIKVRDGVDIALATLDLDTLELQYAGAFNPMYMFRGKQFTEYKPDKISIGGYMEEAAKKYVNHNVQLQTGDTIYLFSDGYADQFGGPQGKKFKLSQLKALLLNLQDQEMNDQLRILEQTIETWKGSHEQVDDMLVIGVRV